MRHVAVIAAALLVFCAPLPAQTQVAEQPPPAAPEVTPLRDDLYLGRAGREHTVFLVTPEGIILGDPLDRKTALWLRDELPKRFGVDIRYVLHTHHHYSRAAGSSVFTETAQTVAHDNIVLRLEAARSDLPERYTFALRPAIRFTREHTVSLGGRTVMLVHVPAARTPDMSFLYFPEDGIVFGDTAVPFGSVPFSFGHSTPGEVFAWIETLGRLKFERILFGDGRMLSRAEFDVLAEYLSALRSAVASGAAAGDSASRVVAKLQARGLAGNPHQPGLAAHTAAALAAATSRWVSVSVGAATSYAWLSSDFCATWTSCSGGGAVESLRMSVVAARSQRFGVVGEATFTGQTWSARSTKDIDEEAASRRSRVAMLLRYGWRRSALSAGILAGGSVTFDDVRGLDRVKRPALLPTGGSHPIAQEILRQGITAGVEAEWHFGSGSIRVPVRVTWMEHPSVPVTRVEASRDVQAGVDITFRLFKRVSFR